MARGAVLLVIGLERTECLLSFKTNTESQNLHALEGLPYRNFSDYK
jgi:hypothetical protein